MSQDELSLKMEEFAGTLGKIAELKKEGQWTQARLILGKSLKHLVGNPEDQFPKLAEIDELASLIKRGNAVWRPHKKTMLIALLKECGDVNAALDPPEGGRGWYRRALHLLLNAAARDELVEYSEILPGVDVLLEGLGDSPVSTETRLLLMREYERKGNFARARAAFQDALENSAETLRVLNLGIVFFERLTSKDDAALAAGGLQRNELEAGLSELFRRRNALSVRSTS